MIEQLLPQETQPTPEQLLEAGGEFLDHFNVNVSPTEQPEEFLEAMAQLDPRYQGGRELVRFELEADQTEWPEETKNVIMRAAEGMRMLETETPLSGQFDVVIALGGARQSNLDRIRYAIEATKGDKAEIKQLIIAGSSRELNEAEQKATENYAPGAKDEFDLCVGAAATVAKENPGLVASVMYVEDKRAGTPDVIEQVLASLQADGSLKKGARVAAITTQIYQASTELDLDRVARQFGVAETFTAGNPSDPNVVANRTPATYLSEVLRTLKATANAYKAEKEHNVAEAERAHQRVIAATGPDEVVVHEGQDGTYRTVKDEDGDLHSIGSDGSRYMSFNKQSGMGYHGPDDHVGHHME